MRRLPAFLLAIPFLPSLSVLADEPAAPTPLEQRRDAKLAEPWLKQCAWFTDYDKARTEAKATGKPIFAYFTRSYAH